MADSALADMDQARIKGRATGAGTGDPTDLTPGQVATLLLTSSTITSGSYAPTITENNGLDAQAADGTFSYIRIGSLVIVSGRVIITPTASAGSVAAARITLPVSSTFTDNDEAWGSGTLRDGTGSDPDMPLLIESVSSQSYVLVSFRSASTSACPGTLMFMYLVI